MWRLQLSGNSLWQHQEEKVFRQFPSVLWYNFVQKQHLLWVTFWKMVCLEMGVVKAKWLCTCEARGSLCHVTECTPSRVSLPTACEGEPCTIVCSELENSSLCVCFYIYISGERFMVTLSCIHALCLHACSPFMIILRSVNLSSRVSACCKKACNGISMQPDNGKAPWVDMVPSVQNSSLVCAGLVHVWVKRGVFLEVVMLRDLFLAVAEECSVSLIYNVKKMRRNLSIN